MDEPFGCDPFLRPDSGAFADYLTDAAVRLLGEAGLHEFTLAAIARKMGITRQAIAYRYGGGKPARARALEVITARFGERWRQWSGQELFAEVPSLALPTTEPERHGVRVWAALGELARGEARRGNESLVSIRREIRQDERAVLAHHLHRWSGVRPQDGDLATITVVADALRFELAADAPRVSAETASRVLRTHIGAATSGSAGAA